MPLTVKRICSISTHRRPSVINAENRLYYQKKHNKASGLTKNVVLNHFETGIYYILDLFNPFLQKHPVALNTCMNVCEHIIRFSKPV